ncbi:glycosyltransferase family 39 protein [Candidatus Giovannonibacteria bacterium]|nr:glycosyltransferase family 39 protein [Candidatus Giovannonibacteria bacterium]
MKNKKYLILAILLAGAVIRFYGISRGDPLNDEIFYGLRAIGPMDFDGAEAQTTPLEWLDPARVERSCGGANETQINARKLPESLEKKICAMKASGEYKGIPWWTKFSFHDHPPLVFWIQHVSVSLLGENNFGMRLPSALFGLASIYLLYLIARRLYGMNTALIAAAFLALTVNSIFVSRVGLQEVFVIFFMLLSSYFFLRALEKINWLFLSAGALGLALLAKYTAIILIPIFLAYLMLKKRDYFRSWQLWVSIFITVFILSPVIIYNIGLYRVAGHFDFQLSYMLGGKPEVWPVQPGKEIGSIANRLREYLPNLRDANSWLFLSITFLGFIGFFKSLFKTSKETFTRHFFLIISTVFLALFIIVIGPSYRFLSMFTPYFALTAALVIAWLFKKIPANYKKLSLIIFGLIIFFETAYSVNSQILYSPYLREHWAFSSLRYENYDWGYNELSDYLTAELRGKRPLVVFEPLYRFLEDKRDLAIIEGEKNGLEPVPVLIVYDANIHAAGQIWVLDRLHIYHAWPVISTETYFAFLQKEGYDFFNRAGFKKFYYISPVNVPLKPKAKLKELGPKFEEALKTKIEPTIIRNHSGSEAFRIYKFY